MIVRTRLAPSPTGYPHIGTLFQGLFDFVFARKHNGTFVIRIEDTDQTRLVVDAEEKIYDALEWLKITPDEGPKYGGNFGPYRQSERLPIYKEYAEKLIDLGHAYYCFCSTERLDEVRKAHQKAGTPPMYDKQCRALDRKMAQQRAATEPHVVRLAVPENENVVVNDLVRGQITFSSSVVDDQVLLKSDGFPTYHLAVVVDDHLMEITHIIRGEEWLSSAPKHTLLYRFFGWQEPYHFHTPLLRNPDRSKLSKRHGHASVSWYLEQGYIPEAVINFLAGRVWNHPEGKEVYPIEEIIRLFDWKDMHIQGPVADLDKLDWLNGQWLRSLSDNDLFERMQPFLPSEADPVILQAALPLIKERLVKLSEVPELTGYFFTAPPFDQKTLEKTSKMDVKTLVDYLSQIQTVLEQTQEWIVPELELALRALQEKMQLKPRPAFMTIRLLLTGQEATPPLFDVMAVLGKETVLSRLKATRNSLGK